MRANRCNLFFIILVLLLNSSCGKNDIGVENSSPITQLDPLWSRVLLDDINGSEGIQGKSMGCNNGNIVIFNGVKNGFQTLNGLDTSSGELVWEINNQGFRNGELAIKYFQQFNNFIFYKTDGSFHIVNIEDGSFIRKEVQEPLSYVYSALGNSIYQTNIKDPGNLSYDECVTRSDYLDPSFIQETICPPFTYERAFPNGYYGYTRMVRAFEENGDTLLWFGWREPTPEPDPDFGPWSGRSYWSLYNQTQKSFIHERILVEDTYSTPGPWYCEYYKGKFYFTDRKHYYVMIG